MCNALVEAKCAPGNLIDFALSPKRLATTEGAVRNTAILLTSGSFVLQTDDDTACEYVSQACEGIRVSSSADPYEMHFYPNKTVRVNEFPFEPDIDPFAIHESVLGRSLGDVLEFESLLRGIALILISWQSLMRTI